MRPLAHVWSLLSHVWVSVGVCPYTHDVDLISGMFFVDIRFNMFLIMRVQRSHTIL